ncbi:Rossmann-fold NAD(P)-binding domain-containing protein [Fodinicola feengrottensis]|uniref:hypothetical protein n=1 Tax=Fodinicola feengrottensis TaxID=435914 RepID=UPI00244163E6|nr:hypothetical protein [Fodinicola feengrottensis]
MTTPSFCSTTPLLLRQDTDGVDVTFERAAARRFDLVIGADGLHSGVRGLVFGPEADCVRHLGLYIATMPLHRTAADPSAVVMHNIPGRSVAVHPLHGEAGAAFMFRGPAIPGFDHRDAERHKKIVIAAYRDGDWDLPDLPDLPGRVRAATDFYFDAISQVRLPTWSRGRVSLVGDSATSCPCSVTGPAWLSPAPTLSPTPSRPPLTTTRLPCVRTKKTPPTAGHRTPARLPARRRVARAIDELRHHSPKPGHWTAPTRAAAKSRISYGQLKNPRAVSDPGMKVIRRWPGWRESP